MMIEYSQSSKGFAESNEDLGDRMMSWSATVADRRGQGRQPGSVILRINDRKGLIKRSIYEKICRPFSILICCSASLPTQSGGRPIADNQWSRRTCSNIADRLTLVAGGELPAASGNGPSSDPHSRWFARRVPRHVFDRFPEAASSSPPG
jgi:hypothetical protein